MELEEVTAAARLGKNDAEEVPQVPVPDRMGGKMVEEQGPVLGEVPQVPKLDQVLGESGGEQALGKNDDEDVPQAPVQDCRLFEYLKVRF